MRFKGKHELVFVLKVPSLFWLIYMLFCFILRVNIDCACALEEFDEGLDLLCMRMLLRYGRWWTVFNLHVCNGGDFIL